MNLNNLNEKGTFFRPLMFEFPSDKNSYEDIESKIMLGEALSLCAFFDPEEKNKTFIFPNSNFKVFPSGNTILNYTNSSFLQMEGKKFIRKVKWIAFIYAMRVYNTNTRYFW